MKEQRNKQQLCRLALGVTEENLKSTEKRVRDGEIFLEGQIWEQESFQQRPIPVTHSRLAMGHWSRGPSASRRSIELDSIRVVHRSAVSIMETVQGISRPGAPGRGQPTAGLHWLARISPGPAGGDLSVPSQTHWMFRAVALSLRVLSDLKIRWLRCVSHPSGSWASPIQRILLPVWWQLHAGTDIDREPLAHHRVRPLHHHVQPHPEPQPQLAVR